MYTLKSIARRSSAWVGVFALVVGVTSFPLATYAASSDSYSALNPLTDRSLTLSSSSPGWAYTDGSGNTTYAPPNSGANGQKTGETFSFNTSSDATSSAGGVGPIKAFTFQYCTQSAGECAAPGNDTGTAGSQVDSVPNQQSDLNVVTSSPTEMSASTYAALAGNKQTSASDDGVDTYQYSGLPDVDNSQGNFIVIVDGTVSSGWSMEASNSEQASTDTTGKNNYITLYNTTGVSIPAQKNVQVIFYATNTNYITNPGSGAFFVRINDYTGLTSATPPAADPSKILDGGVTVANVMNQSIQITTRVLETMEFSVGTVDPDTLSDTQLATATGTPGATHGQCNPILTSMTNGQNVNVLTMGDVNGDNSLSTQDTYATHSYWRLSSNSSAGATVYYSGNTLANTEGNEITPIGTTAALPSPGSEQFGLALATVGSTATQTQPAYGVSWNVDPNGYEQGADTNAGVNTGANPVGVDPSFTTDTAKWSPQSVSKNTLTPLIPSPTYADGAGPINTTVSGDATTSPTAKFAFDENSTAVPVALASENSTVVNCVTAKVRYIANIAATTPAGMYTTKINYIAAPEY